MTAAIATLHRCVPNRSQRHRGGPILLAVTAAVLLLNPSTSFLPAPGGVAPISVGPTAQPGQISSPGAVEPVHAVEVFPSVATTAKVPDQIRRTKNLLGSPRASSTGGIAAGGATAAAALAYAAIKGAQLTRSGQQSKISLNSGGAAQAPEDMLSGAYLALGVFISWVAAMWAIQHGVLPVPFLAAGQELYFPIIATFIAGYGVIVLEEQLEINKAATALILGVSVWAFIGTGLNLSPEVFETDIKECLEDVSEVVFFLLGALTIVEIMDAHKGFDIITKQISAKKSRDLLVVIGVLTFFLSSVLNNLTVVIVMIALLQKVVKDDDLRLKLGGIVVVVSNAGGAWTPIGDITTTMMYIGGQVTTVPLITNLVFPSILCLIGTLGFEFLKMDGEKEFERPSAASGDDVSPNGQNLVFWGGLCGMVSVPVFTAFTQCPAWSGMMLVLGVLGLITSLLHPPGHDSEKYQMKGALERVEVPDCLFFLGVLFAVGGLEKVGLLKAFAGVLNSLIDSEVLIATLLGFASAVVDNVPLVAASQGMYDLAGHPANSALWNLICYCAATGGSLLVIGSAAGVAFLGLEKKVTFGWYVQEIAPAALVGYLLGIGGCVLQSSLGLTIQ